LFQAYSSEGEKGDSHQEENKNGSLYIEWSNSIAQSNKKRGKISKGQGAVTRRITEFVWLWSGETHSYGWARTTGGTDCRWGDTPAAVNNVMRYQRGERCTGKG
jgi:hypothetical protein